MTLYPPSELYARLEAFANTYNTRTPVPDVRLTPDAEVEVKHDRSPSPLELSDRDTESKVNNEDYIPGGRVTPLHGDTSAV